ncbi:MAG: hypothetical protein J7L19_03025 [Dehalococcoidia bacterium]|nr:hypothetical protein [Dehalococcoidia bacterium]
MNKRICGIKNGGLAGILSVVVCLILAFAFVGLNVPGIVQAGDGNRIYPVMQPDRETMEEWIESYNSAPRASIEMRGLQGASTGGLLSLLDHLDYTASERDQGSCGNCWAWAGTGCMGIALDVQEGIKGRLSVQYLNSCEDDIIGKPCCDGGWLSNLADFYTATNMAIPWSNTNAYWQDGDASCDTNCGSISTDPNYPITSIQEQVVPTLPLDGVMDQATAIANIKDVLSQDRAVWFGFFLPTGAAWSDFKSFWNTSGESIVYDMDKFCGVPDELAGAHAVLCVGYNDTDPDNAYWIMLNSWGTTARRPNGLFRIDMDMDYGCSYPICGYAFYWQTLDIAFAMNVPDITLSPESFDVTLPSNTTQDYTLTIGNEGSANLDYTISDEDTTEAGRADCTWLDETPDSGTVVTGGPADNITVSFNSTGLSVGDYSADIVVSSNDPDENSEIVPVVLHVVVPDLVITEKHEEWIDFEAKSYNITCTVENQGDLVAGASKTGVCIDAGSWGFYDCPALEPGASNCSTLGPFILSGDSDSILVCADKQDEIDESDEGNNCSQNTWGTVIAGVTKEVNCQPLGEVTIKLYNNGGVEGMTTSDGEGNYSFTAYISTQGNYELVASKADFLDETQPVTVGASNITLDFCGDHGLIPLTTPKGGGLDYFLLCMNLYLEGWGECNIGLDKFLATLNAYLESW